MDGNVKEFSLGVFSFFSTLSFSFFVHSMLSIRHSVGSIVGFRGGLALCSYKCLAYDKSHFSRVTSPAGKGETLV